MPGVLCGARPCGDPDDMQQDGEAGGQCDAAGGSHNAIDTTRPMCSVLAGGASDCGALVRYNGSPAGSLVYAMASSATSALLQTLGGAAAMGNHPIPLP